jgi:hypothetical protein
MYVKEKCAGLDTDAGGVCLAPSSGVVQYIYIMHFRDDPQRRDDSGVDRQIL